jgi:hypothetical protein
MNSESMLKTQNYLQGFQVYNLTVIHQYQKLKQCSVNNQRFYLRHTINTELKVLPMSSSGTVLEIIERQSGPDTPPKMPTPHPLKRETTFVNFSVLLPV